VVLAGARGHGAVGKERADGNMAGQQADDSSRIYICKERGRQRQRVSAPQRGLRKCEHNRQRLQNVALMDDVTTFSQDNEGAQSLLNAVQEFELWSNMRLNKAKRLALMV
jgi:hypothetical protein